MGKSKTVDKIKTTSPNIYVAIWRWHFYAGLLSIPVCVLLAVTGSFYLFKPYLEPVLYRDLWTVPVGEERLSPAQQITIAQQKSPQLTVKQITQYAQQGRTTEVALIDATRETTLVYVDPYSGRITGELNRSAMLMQRIKKLHGELLLGVSGSAVVELTACWAVVLIMTGVYLTWPRGKSNVKGVLIPRLRSGKQIFWRDMHAVVGIYSSLLVLILIVTGLPWSNVWGGAFKKIQAATNQSAPAAASRGRVPFKSNPISDAQPISLEKAIMSAENLGFSGTYTVLLPRGKRGVYGFTKRPIDHSQSRFLYLDQYSGKAISQATWSDFPIAAKARSWGIRLHQGELGLVNLIAALLAAIGLIWVAITGFFMWWRRRPSGSLGVPDPPKNWNGHRWLAFVTVVLGVVFPLVGASLLLMWAFDRWLFPWFPGLSNFLGLKRAV